MPLAVEGMHLLLLLLVYLIDVHTGRSTVVSITLTFMLRPHISLSFFSSWLCHDSQSAKIALGLVCTVCIPCIVACIEFCIAGIVIMLPHFCPFHYQQFMVCDDMYFTCKTVVVDLSSQSRVLSASLSSLLYHHSVLHGHLFAKVMGQSISLPDN